MSGSKDACEIVKIAQELGIIVYATDWYRDSPVKRIADKSFMVSTADVDAIVELCKTEGIDGIFSGYTDSVLPYCQAACEKLGLPFWGTEQNIQMCIDKKLFKKACEQSSLPIVPYVVMNESNYLTKLDDITVPVVFKPVDNSGSRGVYKVFNDSEVKFYCEKSLSYSKSKEILAEKLMDANNEFSAYYMLNNGNAYLTAMADKIIDDYDLVILNFANGDMVGHTGDFDATVKAVEVVDEWVGKIYNKVMELNGTLIVTADHGHLNSTSILLSDYEDFYNTLDGDVWVEGRMCAFKVKKGMHDTFVELFNKYFPDTAKTKLKKFIRLF